jgi:putative transposase
MPTFFAEEPLAPPPGFSGLNPALPIHRYERHLPHWRQQGATYFVTFRLADSLPQEKLQVLDTMRQKWDSIPEHQKTDQRARLYSKAVLEKIERWVDSGYGACWFRVPEFADQLLRAILHHHKVQYLVPVGVIMPNHCHLVMKPFDRFDLESLLGQIKSVSATFVNRKLGRTGPLWQQESYDRIIRDENHLFQVIQYIGRNPEKAEVAATFDHRYRWVDPEWQSSGWGFINTPPES